MVNEVKGYSLIEVLTVIVIVSILAGLSSIAYRAIIVQGAMHQARADLVATLEQAKTLSITGLPHGIVFDNDRQYRLVQLNEQTYCSTSTGTTGCNTVTNVPCPAGEYCTKGNMRRDATDSLVTLETHTVGNLVQVSWNRSIDASSPCVSATDSELWFDRRGVPRCSNWELGMSTVSVVSGSRALPITIDRAGKIRYE